jgi:hypothetical protein
LLWFKPVATSPGWKQFAVCVPNVWPAPDLQVDFCDLVSISLH